MARVVVSLPPTAKRGEVIEIRTLAGHRWKPASATPNSAS